MGWSSGKKDAAVVVVADTTRHRLSFTKSSQDRPQQEEEKSLLLCSIPDLSFLNKNGFSLEAVIVEFVAAVCCCGFIDVEEEEVVNRNDVSRCVCSSDNTTIIQRGAKSRLELQWGRRLASSSSAVLGMVSSRIWGKNSRTCEARTSS